MIGLYIYSFPLFQAERGDLELRVVIPSNNGQMEDENHPLLELQLEAEVLLIQKLLVMEVHSVQRIPTATNHQAVCHVESVLLPSLVTGKPFN